MIVQRVVMPTTGATSWTVLADDGSLVESAETYLSYLAALERSPNTQRAYATSLKLWFEFLARVGVEWTKVSVDDVARFVAWLRAPAANVIVLETGCGLRSPATVNRHLAAVFGFYEHHARAGVVVAAELTVWRRVGRGTYKPFLHHVTAGRPVPTRPVKLLVPRRVPRTLSVEQLVTVLAAPQRARDRFLLALLAETGMRIGQALGLRHSDFVSRAKQVWIVPRVDNANGARAKLRSPAVIPVTAGLVRCYSDYMHNDYGDIDSDYVFVNLWGGRIGAPLTYATVHKLIGRIQACTGIDFTVHMLRHTHATELIRSGVAIDVVARLLTHRSSTTTSQIYIHLDVADVRTALQRAGVWDQEATVR
ncbi:MAG: site-specific integrase [Actinomycetota bacterium]|nr:site-specific integrase [Actinomycetota bacterium]